MKKLFGFSVLVLLFTLQAKAQPSPEEREKFHTAMESCIQENNLSKPERGTRPSDEDRAKMEACLKSKGISKPEHPRGGGRHHGKRDQKEQESSEE